MEELSRAERYLFIIALVMIVLAYFAGATQILKVAGPQANALLLTAQGRDQQGHFSAYPSNAPA